MNKQQHTVWFHSNDVLSIHMDPEVNTKFGAWANETYGKLKPAELNHRKIHEFLGMTLDYSTKSKFHILQEHHVDNIVSSWTEEISKVK